MNNMKHEIVITPFQGSDGGPGYRAACSCGWQSGGFVVRVHAERDGIEHAQQSKESDAS
jgi:hypothetical protein